MSRLVIRCFTSVLGLSMTGIGCLLKNWEFPLRCLALDNVALRPRAKLHTTQFLYKNILSVRSPSLDFSIAHRWAQASGPQHNPQWAMGSVLKSQLNPQPINGRPSKPIKSPFLCPNIALARIKSIFYANTNLYIPLYHIVIVRSMNLVDIVLILVSS